MSAGLIFFPRTLVVPVYFLSPTCAPEFGVMRPRPSLTMSDDRISSVLEQVFHEF